MLKKKIIAFGFAASVVAASVSASAGTLGSTPLSGTNSDSSEVHLGSGDHTLKATGTRGSGEAFAKKVNKLFPDSTVAQVDVTSPYSSSDGFTAVNSTNGANQSYYVKWKGNSSTSSAQVEITH